MNTIICNDFSLHMLSEDCNIDIKQISYEMFNNIIENTDYISCVGDENIADFMNIKFNRGNILLDKNTRLIVIKSLDDVSKKLNSFSKFEFYDIKYGKCS